MTSHGPQIDIIVNVSGGLVQGVEASGLPPHQIVNVHIRDFDNGEATDPKDVDGYDDGDPYQEWTETFEGKL